MVGDNKKIKIKNKKQENLLKTEINNEKNNKNQKKKTNDIPKNISTNFNYLRYTVSALNKIVKKKRILNKTHNNSLLQIMHELHKIIILSNQRC